MPQTSATMLYNPSIHFESQRRTPSLSDFEGVIPFVLVPAAISWWRWYGSIFSVNRLASRMRDRAALLTVPISCIGLLLLVLRLAASSDVQTDPFCLSFYVALGAGWLGVATFVFPLLGISVRDEVVERHNPSASWALSGALIAVTLCFAGANIGNGPGPYAVLFCA